MLFVFGRVVWSDIVQATAFWGFFSELLLAVRSPDRKAAMKVGAWAGALVNTKYLYVLSLLGSCAFGITQIWTRLGWRKVVALAGWAVLASLPFAVPIGWFNYVRNGMLLNTGYGNNEPFQESILGERHFFVF